MLPTHGGKGNVKLRSKREYCGPQVSRNIAFQECTQLTVWWRKISFQTPRVVARCGLHMEPTEKRQLCIWIPLRNTSSNVLQVVLSKGTAAGTLGTLNMVNSVVPILAQATRTLF